MPALGDKRVPDQVAAKTGRPVEFLSQGDYTPAKPFRGRYVGLAKTRGKQYVIVEREGNDRLYLAERGPRHAFRKGAAVEFDGRNLAAAKSKALSAIYKGRGKGSGKEISRY